MRPLSDYVVIHRQPDTQVGRIIVPDNVETKPRIGLVEAIGPGRRRKDGSRAPMAVQVGDRVVFDAGGKGYVTALPGQHRRDARLLLPERDILAVLEPDAQASAVGSPWPGYIVDGVRG